MDGLSGSIKTMSLRDLMFFLGSRRLSGTLQCEQDGDRKVVEVRHGAAVMVSASSPSDYFSELLVEKGYIDAAQLQRAIATGSRPLGRSLVTMGVIDEGRLREALTMKISATLHTLMRWRKGSFQFVEYEEDDQQRDEQEGHGMLRHSAVEAQVALIEAWRADPSSNDPPAWLQLQQVLTAGPHGEASSRAAEASQDETFDTDFADVFRREVGDRLSERGRGKRFPRDLQRRAVAYYRERTRKGSFLSEVARELGLPPPTLRRWVLDAPPETPPADASREALVSRPDPSLPGAPVLVGPGGLRIEGLDLKSLAELLRRL